MTIAKDLRTWLLTSGPLTAVVGNRVHNNKVPEGYEGPYLWFGRATTETEDALDDVAGVSPFMQSFDVELYSDDLDDTDTAGKVLIEMNNSRGAFGSGTVQVVLVQEHFDDYTPRGVNDDTGRFRAAVRLDVKGYIGT